VVDIYLCPVPAESNPADILLRDTTEGCSSRRFVQFVAAKGAPVVAQALYDDLVDRYGKERGRTVYFAMEREAKGPFGPGMKYDVAQRAGQPIAVKPPGSRDLTKK
jgi:hypothetical protein